MDIERAPFHRFRIGAPEDPHVAGMACEVDAALLVVLEEDLIALLARKALVVDEDRFDTGLPGPLEDGCVLFVADDAGDLGVDVARGAGVVEGLEVGPVARCENGHAEHAVTLTRPTDSDWPGL